MNEFLNMTLSDPKFLVALVWVMIWKGFALWISARKNEKVWFVALLLINTLGILEILYIFVFSKFGKEKKQEVA